MPVAQRLASLPIENYGIHECMFRFWVVYMDNARYISTVREMLTNESRMVWYCP